MLNMHLVRIFATVVDLGSFTRAAESLSISQSAASRDVQELERQLGMPLLERRARGVTPTEAGALLAAHARRIFDIERLAEESLAALRGLQRGRLAIGASSTIGIYMLPPLLGAFGRRYPGIELFLDIGNTQQIVERIIDHRLDVAFLEGPAEAHGLDILPWREDELVVIAAPDHPLAGGQQLTTTDLAGAAFVLREAGSGTREVMEQALVGAGVEVKTVMELGSTEAVKQAVAAGLGISIVSRYTIQLELAAGRLAVLPLGDLRIRRRLTRAQLADRPASPALEMWLGVAQGG
ncbi:LysR family transcriptional regulator [Oscillochloris sp. ZM17-4]|nr:LysR family transcriptional regulator [Oscillochloris sp. ZM17-4]MBX0329557.1 LysR family transcriptional regulator [Oscillochloris sp. ZM17-4]